MKAAVLLFPGLNREGDAMRALEQASGHKPSLVWHAEHELPAGTDLVLVPGGFSYGDYLRCGAIAGRANIMDAVRAHAARGGLVVGICNGFQILCESGLLPGALVRNRDLRFICEHVRLRVENNANPFLSAASVGSVLNIPIAHGEGNYVCDAATLAQLKAENRILVRYCDKNGNVTPEVNPNGTTENIAGICNAARNVFGLMPHPERACDPLLGSNDGRLIFQSILAALNKAKAA